MSKNENLKVRKSENEKKVDKDFIEEALEYCSMAGKFLAIGYMDRVGVHGVDEASECMDVWSGIMLELIVDAFGDTPVNLLGEKRIKKILERHQKVYKEIIEEMRLEKELEKASREHISLKDTDIKEN